MVSGSIKFGAYVSLFIVILAYLYKRHLDNALVRKQERLNDVLAGLLQAEQAAPSHKTKVAVGFGGCEDIFVDGLELFKVLNLSAPNEANHPDTISNKDELSQLFAYFFQHGAAAERFIANRTLFNDLVDGAAKVPEHRWALGGNAPAMAKRFALEGLEVMVGARVAASAVAQLPTSVKVVGTSVTRSDVHLLMEYNTNDKWGQYTSPRANRLIVHSDSITPFLDGMEDFISEVVTFQPSLVVIGGLQMMDNFPYDEGVRQLRLQKLRQFLQDLPRSTLVHFEMASFTDMSLLSEIIDNVVCYCDSIGANEQELPNILSALERDHVVLISDSHPRVATVLDQMRKVYELLKEAPETDGRRKLTRIHIHTLAFQAILTTNSAPWKSTSSAAAKAALTAHRYTCGSHDIDLTKAKLILDESFSLSKTTDSKRVLVNNTSPVSCWEEAGYKICVSPVLVCTQVLQTGGGGDNVSAAGLVLQI